MEHPPGPLTCFYTGTHLSIYYSKSLARCLLYLTSMIRFHFPLGINKGNCLSNAIVIPILVTSFSIFHLWLIPWAFMCFPWLLLKYKITDQNYWFQKICILFNYSQYNVAQYCDLLPYSHTILHLSCQSTIKLTSYIYENGLVNNRS